MPKFHVSRSASWNGCFVPFKWKCQFYYMTRKPFNFISLESRRTRDNVIMLRSIINGELQVTDLLLEVPTNVPNVDLRSIVFHIPSKRTNASRNSPLMSMFRPCNDLRMVNGFHCANIKFQLKKYSTTVTNLFFYKKIFFYAVKF